MYKHDVYRQNVHTPRPLSDSNTATFLMEVGAFSASSIKCFSNYRHGNSICYLNKFHEGQGGGANYGTSPGGGRSDVSSNSSRKEPSDLLDLYAT